RPVKNLLRINGNQRIEKKDQQPEAGGLLDQRKKILRREEAHRQRKENQANRITNQDRSQERAVVPPGEKALHGKLRIAAQKEEGDEARYEQIRNGQVGNAAEVNEQWDAGVAGEEFQREKQETHIRITALGASGVSRFDRRCRMQR